MSAINRSVAVGAVCVGLLSACESEQTPVHQQPSIGAQVVAVLEVDGYQFRDLNKNGQLDIYEDWREPHTVRVENLLGQMSLEEKAGMMLIDTLNSEIDGQLSDKVTQYINTEKMTRFVFRNAITDTPNHSFIHPFSGPEITPLDAAQFLNSAQEAAAATRLGIPLLFKSNPRNHVDPDPRFGISAAAGALSAWPKPAGLAATGDLGLIDEFARVVKAEWTALGIRGMYGYTLDLATEPRWFRVHETFSEDADFVAEIARTLTTTFQGSELSQGGIALTMKHFPGGGPQEGGGDPHYDFGKNQSYPSGGFDYQLRPFEAAIDAGVAALMPYYGIPVDQPYQPNNVGMAFSKGIVNDLLREELGYEGVVNSDTGIIGERSWGLEDKSESERLVIAIVAGNDVLSGFHSNAMIRDLVTEGRISEARIDESVRRLLAVQFRLGLFENPYVDINAVSEMIGREDFQAQANRAQRRSIVLLQNPAQLLPLRSQDQQRQTLYTLGIDVDALAAERDRFVVTVGDYDASIGETRVPVPEGTDAALIRVIVNNDPVKRELFFGGASSDELDLLSFSDMAAARSWNIKPSLDDIHAVMAEVGAENTVLAIYFRQPYVLDVASGLREAGAILATFGVTDDAILDVVSGESTPVARLPFALAGDAGAITSQAPDAPGYASKETLFPLGWGLTYTDHE